MPFLTNSCQHSCQTVNLLCFCRKRPAKTPEFVDSDEEEDDDDNQKKTPSKTPPKTDPKPKRLLYKLLVYSCQTLNIRANTRANYFRPKPSITIKLLDPAKGGKKGGKKPTIEDASDEEPNDPINNPPDPTIRQVVCFDISSAMYSCQLFDTRANTRAKQG